MQFCTLKNGSSGKETRFLKKKHSYCIIHPFTALIFTALQPLESPCNLSHHLIYSQVLVTPSSPHSFMTASTFIHKNPATHSSHTSVRPLIHSFALSLYNDCIAHLSVHPSIINLCPSLTYPIVLSVWDHRWLSDLRG